MPYWEKSHSPGNIVRWMSICWHRQFSNSPFKTWRAPGWLGGWQVGERSSEKWQDSLACCGPLLPGSQVMVHHQVAFCHNGRFIYHQGLLRIHVNPSRGFFSLFLVFCLFYWKTLSTFPGHDYSTEFVSFLPIEQDIFCLWASDLWPKPQFLLCKVRRLWLIGQRLDLVVFKSSLVIQRYIHG